MMENLTEKQKLLGVGAILIVCILISPLPLRFIFFFGLGFVLGKLVRLLDGRK